jgi:hypothetical protein
LAQLLTVCRKLSLRNSSIYPANSQGIISLPEGVDVEEVDLTETQIEEGREEFVRELESRGVRVVIDKAEK